MFEMEWREEDFKRIIDYLRQKEGIFKEVRGKFNIGDELGLAVLPEWNNYCDGLLAPVKLNKFAKLPKDRMIVEPRPRFVLLFWEKVYIISIYFCPGFMENRKGITLDENYFLVSEEVITGLFAHEFAEYLYWHNKKLIKSEFLQVLENEVYLERFPRSLGKIRFNILSQCPADLLASLCGFKKEMIALLRFLKEKHMKFENLSPDYSSYFRPPLQMAMELKLRIDFIELAMGK